MVRHLVTADIANVRKFFNWPHEPFVIPDSIYQQWNRLEQGQLNEQEWLNRVHQFLQDATRAACRIFASY